MHNFAKRRSKYKLSKTMARKKSSRRNNKKKSKRNRHPHFRLKALRRLKNSNQLSKRSSRSYSLRNCWSQMLLKRLRSKLLRKMSSLVFRRISLLNSSAKSPTSRKKICKLRNLRPLRKEFWTKITHRKKSINLKSLQ